MAANRLLQARELDDDEAVEFLRALEDLEFAAARQDLAAELLQDARYLLAVLLGLVRIVGLRARDPISDHLILHANGEHRWHFYCGVRHCRVRTVRSTPNCFPSICFWHQR